MANAEHLKTILRGVKVWNEWRQTDAGSAPNLRSANLSSANLSAYLSVLLNEANLNGVDLSRTDLIYANLIGTDLIGANLSNADLNSARLSNANLSNANLSNADLSNANLSGADLSGARLCRTVFSDIDLSEAKGLLSVKHLGPSEITISTMYESRGNIPEEFLRGAGVPDNFITFMRSLTGAAWEYYSCFISYSSNDQDFVTRLYNDLQGSGVRCWFAPEDMKIGDRIRDEIDRAIRLHDKLLLVLSVNSVDSDWVEKEVETAMERERKEKRIVLFPITLDDAVIETEKAWAADIRRTRHIGDFRHWKQHDAYKKGFDRLLRDLKAGEDIT